MMTLTTKTTHSDEASSKHKENNVRVIPAKTWVESNHVVARCSRTIAYTSYENPYSYHLTNKWPKP